MLLPYPLFAIPSLPLSYIPRNILCPNWLQRNRTQIVILEAGGGYGKTTILVEYLHAISSQVIWYPLEHLHRPDLLTFTQNLVRAVTVVDSRIGQQFQEYLYELFKDNDSVKIESALSDRLLPALLNQIADWEKPTALVLENYHLINDAKIDSFLFRLFESAPQNLRFFISSRRSLDALYCTQWQASGRLLTIDQSQMKLSFDEAQRAAFVANPEIDDETVRSLHEVTHGWPLLFMLACREQTLLPASFNSFAGISIQEQANRYLLDLLAAESTERQTFLLYTAILDDFTPAICDYLLECNQSRQILFELGAGIFIRPQPSSPELLYRHAHGIIKSFLLSRLNLVCSANEVAQLYNRMGQWYEVAKMPELALVYYWRAGNQTAIEELLEDQVLQLGTTLQITQFEHWLALLPDSLFSHSFRLSLCQAILFVHQENELAEDRLLSLIQLCKQRADIARMALATAELSYFYYHQADYQKAYQLVSQICVDQLDLRLQAHLYQRRGIALTGIDYDQLALANFSKALQLRQQLNTPDDDFSMLALLRQQAFLYGAAGFPLRAVQMLRKAYQRAGQLPNHPINIAWVLNNLSVQYRLMGEFECAKNVIHKANQLLDRYRQMLPGHRLFGYLEVNEAHIHSDDYDDEFMQMWAQKRSSQLKSQPQGVSEEALLDYYLSHPALFEKGFELAQKLWTQERQSAAATVRSYVTGVLGIAYLVNGNPLQAQKLLVEGLHIWCSYAQSLQHINRTAMYPDTCNGDLLPEDQVEFSKTQILLMVYLTETYCQLGQESQALVTLNQTLSLMHERNYYSLDVWIPQILAHLCYQALVHEIEPEYVEALVRKRFRTRYGEPFRQLLLDPRPQVRHRGERILAQMSDQNLQKAYDLLQGCKIESTQQRLLSWLVDGWLTPYGLLYLEQLFTWRELETFLLWIHPTMQAETETMARAMQLSPDTVKGYLKTVKQILRTHFNLAIEGRGAQMPAFAWAIKQGVVDAMR